MKLIDLAWLIDKVIKGKIHNYEYNQIEVISNLSIEDESEVVFESDQSPSDEIQGLLRYTMDGIPITDQEIIPRDSHTPTSIWTSFFKLLKKD